VLFLGNEAVLNFDLNAFTTKDALLHAIQNNIPYGGGNTNTTGALRLMRTAIFTPQGGDRIGKPDVCILITDGVPTREVDLLPAEVAAIKNQGIKIMAIGVTNKVQDIDNSINFLEYAQFI